MAINRISGNILQDNLTRGDDLAFQTNLLYIDVGDHRIGINTASTTHVLTVLGNADVSGNSSAENVEVRNFLLSNTATITANLAVGNVTVEEYFQGNTGNFLGNLAVAQTVTANAVVANTAEFAGDAVTGNGAVIVGVTGTVTPNTVAAFVGNVDSHSQVTVQNISSGTLATTELRLQADSGNADAYRVNLGIGSGTYQDPEFFGDLASSNTDAWLYTVATSQQGPSTGIGNLILGSTNGAIKLFVGNTAQANVVTTVTSNGLDVSGNLDTDTLNVGDAFANNVTISDTLTVANIAITGNIALGNLAVSNTTILANIANANITLQPSNNSLVIANTTSGLVVATGNTVQRPAPATTGTLRFNTDSQRLEVYDGAEWDQVVSDVTLQIITPDGANISYSLDRTSTTAALLVSINGVVQLPTVAYTVAGNVITFAEIPLTTDIVDIRFL